MSKTEYTPGRIFHTFRNIGLAVGLAVTLDAINPQLNTLDPYQDRDVPSEITLKDPKRIEMESKSENK